MSANAIHAHTDSDLHLVGFGALRVLICEEAGEWFAQGVDLDYAASGDSLADVQRRFEKGLAATVHLHLARFQSIEGLLKYPPAAIWERLKPGQTFSLNMVTIHDMTAVLRELPFAKIVYLKGPAATHAAAAQG